MDSEIDSDEGAYDLREVSSDVEIHRDDLEGLESDERWVHSSEILHLALSEPELWQPLRGSERGGRKAN